MLIRIHRELGVIFPQQPDDSGVNDSNEVPQSEGEENGHQQEKVFALKLPFVFFIMITCALDVSGAIDYPIEIIGAITYSVFAIAIVTRDRFLASAYSSMNALVTNYEDRLSISEECAANWKQFAVKHPMHANVVVVRMLTDLVTGLMKLSKFAIQQVCNFPIRTPSRTLATIVNC